MKSSVTVKLVERQNRRVELIKILITTVLPSTLASQINSTNETVKLGFLEDIREL